MTFTGKTVVFIFVVFIANMIHAVTGFSGTMLAMPLSIRILGANDARVTLNLIGIFNCVLLGIKSYRLVNWREFRKITLMMLLGMIPGMVVFKRAEIDGLLYVYGLLITMIALKGIFIKRTFHTNPMLGAAVLVCAGFIHGVFVSGGALLVAYAKDAMPEKYIFRATLTPVWIALNSILLMEQVLSNQINASCIYLSSLSILPIFVSVWLGTWLFDHISHKLFWLTANILLLLSGISIFL